MCGGEQYIEQNLIGTREYRSRETKLLLDINDNITEIIDTDELFYLFSMLFIVKTSVFQVLNIL